MIERVPYLVLILLVILTAISAESDNQEDWKAIISSTTNAMVGKVMPIFFDLFLDFTDRFGCLLSNRKYISYWATSLNCKA